MVVNRGKASSLDIDNYYAMLNKNGGNEIKVRFIESNCYRTGTEFLKNKA